MENHNVLIGMMYSGENEYSLAKNSLKKQTFKQWELFTIENKPNKEAHDLLYKTFMASSNNYTLFMKLDADMVCQHKGTLLKIIELFDGNKGLDLVGIDVLDWYSNILIPRQFTYSNRCQWKENTDQLIVDHHPTNIRNYLTISESPIAGMILHSPNPTPLQSYQFGIHRALKACLIDRLEKKIPRVLGHWTILSHIWQHYQRKPDIRLLYAIAGVEFVLNNAMKPYDFNYKHSKIQEIFTQEVLPYSEAELRKRYHKEWSHPLLNQKRWFNRLQQVEN